MVGTKLNHSVLIRERQREITGSRGESYVTMGTEIVEI